MIEQNEFAQLGLSEQMLEAVRAKGFETPTQVQKLTIPKLLAGQNDLIAQSQTGTGKTAAYGLPMLQMLRPLSGKRDKADAHHNADASDIVEKAEKTGKPAKAVQAIVLVPTRELALQVMEEMLSYNSASRLSIAAIYGGASMSEQLRRLSRGIDIVVGTPGRVLDHIRRGTLDLSGIKYLVLDEADEMLNMGFIEDVEEIIAQTPEQRRVLLFSATMPERIVKLSKRYMRDAEVVRTESKQITADLTDQIYFEVREDDKLDALTRIIDIEPEFYGIVFSRTKIGVDELVNKLIERGYAAEALHGDVSQAQREKILRNFKNRRSNILVATDVAARGIDINNLTHVINYSLPQDTESYVHRIGRTGRAGNQGTAITFISSSEFRRFGSLKRELGTEIKKETLPSGQDVVAIKRRKIKDDLQEIIAGDNWADYGDMAEEILSAYPAEVALSALLRLAFRSELDQSAYPEIRSFSVDRKGTARVFIAVGRRDGYDVRKLIAMLKRECGLRDNKITDVALMDDFSFVSVPFADAEHAIRKLNQIRKGDKPLAKIAKPKEGEGEPHNSRARAGDNEPRAGKTRAERRESLTVEGAARRGSSPEAEFTDAKARIRDDKPPRNHDRKELSESRTAGEFSDSRSARHVYEKAPAREKPRPVGDDPVPAAEDKQAGRGAMPKEYKWQAKGRKEHSSEKTTPAKGRKERPTEQGAPAKDRSAEQRMPAKGRKKTVDAGLYRDIDPVPSEKANSGFDWSIFETGGNSWDRPSRKKKR